MDRKDKERWSRNGIDVESALERFMGNEALYERFLRGFAEDKTYDALAEAIKAGDAKKAFLEAHTLKGVCANLSLIELLNPVNAVTEALRGGDLDTAKRLLPELTEQYRKTAEAVRGKDNE